MKERQVATALASEVRPSFAAFSADGFQARDKRDRAVDRQKGGPGPGHQPDRGFAGRDQRPETADAGRDQRRIRQRADQAQDEDMLAQQSLAQDVGVLRADRDDQRRAEKEAGHAGGEDR